MRSISFRSTRRGERGVLCVNNEYTDDALMFAGHPGFAARHAAKVASTWSKHPQMVAVVAGGARRVGHRGRARARPLADASRIRVSTVASRPTRRSMSAARRAVRHCCARRPIPPGTRVLGTFGELCRRRDAVGHVPHGRREHPGLLRQLADAQGARRRRSVRRRCPSALPHVEGAFAVRLGSRRRALRSRARRRTSRSASAGSSRSIRTIRSARRSSARRSAALRTKARAR